MTTCDLILQDCSRDGLRHFPALAELVDEPIVPQYGLCDFLNASIWLLQCLGTTLRTENTYASYATPELPPVIAMIGEFTEHLTELRDLIEASQSDPHDRRYGYVYASPIAELESTPADLMPDEASDAEIAATLDRRVHFSPAAPTEETR